MATTIHQHKKLEAHKPSPPTGPAPADSPRSQQLKDLRQKRLLYYQPPNHVPANMKVIKMRPISQDFTNKNSSGAIQANWGDSDTSRMGGKTLSSKTDKPIQDMSQIISKKDSGDSIPTRRCTPRDNSYVKNASADILPQINCGNTCEPSLSGYKHSIFLPPDQQKPREKAASELRTSQFRFSLTAECASDNYCKSDDDISLSSEESEPSKIQSETFDVKKKHTNTSSTSIRDITEPQYEMDFSNLNLTGDHMDSYKSNSCDHIWTSSKDIPKDENPENDNMELLLEDMDVMTDVVDDLTQPSLESILGKERFERLMRNIEASESLSDTSCYRHEPREDIWRDSARESPVAAILPQNSPLYQEDEESGIAALFSSNQPLETGLGEINSGDLGLETHRPNITGGDPIFSNTYSKQSVAQQPVEMLSSRNYRLVDKENVRFAFSIDQIYARANMIGKNGEEGMDHSLGEDKTSLASEDKTSFDNTSDTEGLSTIHCENPPENGQIGLKTIHCDEEGTQMVQESLNIFDEIKEQAEYKRLPELAISFDEESVFTNVSSVVNGDPIQKHSKKKIVSTEQLKHQIKQAHLSSDSNHLIAPIKSEAEPIQRRITVSGNGKSTTEESVSESTKDIDSFDAISSREKFRSRLELDWAENITQAPAAENIEDEQFVYEEESHKTDLLPNHLRVELSLNLASSVDTTATSINEQDSAPSQCTVPSKLVYAKSHQSTGKLLDVKIKKDSNMKRRKHSNKPKQRPHYYGEDDIKFEYNEDIVHQPLPEALRCELSLNLRDSIDSCGNDDKRNLGQQVLPVCDIGPVQEMVVDHPPAIDICRDPAVEGQPGLGDASEGEDAAVVSTDYQEFLQRLMSDTRFQGLPQASQSLPQLTKSKSRPKSAGSLEGQRPELHRGRQSMQRELYHQKWQSSSQSGSLLSSKQIPRRPSSAKASMAKIHFEDNTRNGLQINRPANSRGRTRPVSADRRSLVLAKKRLTAKSVDSAAFVEQRAQSEHIPDALAIQPVLNSKGLQRESPRGSPKDYSHYMQLTPRVHSGEISFMLCLPDEIMLEIFSYLHHADLFKCARVCHHFKRVALDASLWKYVSLKKRVLTDEMLSQIGHRHPVSLALIQCRGDKVTDDGLRKLFRHTAESLKELNVTGCCRGQLTGENIILHAGNRCPHISMLDVSWCNLSDNGLIAIAENSHSLNALCVNGCQAISDEAVHHLVSKHGIYLRVLELFGCFNLTSTSLLSISSYCKSLETLNLGQCWKMTDNALAQLTHSLSKVTNLDLRGCKQMTDGTVGHVVRNCRLLKTLALANCPNLTDSSLAEIAAYTPQLRSLDICGCKKMTSMGVKTLAMACTELQYLDLSSSGISHKGISSLASYCYRRLEVLKINFCKQITITSVTRLAKNCKKLKKLYLYGITTIRNTEPIQEANSKLWIEM